MQLTVDGDPEPICPHCKKQIEEVICLPLNIEEAAMASDHETYTLIFPHSLKALGLQRGYSWQPGITSLAEIDTSF